ncbi:hypothetical protein KM908_14585 [Alkalihalobacillus clausii]|uniref:hypothetical protein n=1 Tax=Shouchella clausii TaxID=79880 RepID=UPI001C216368|nr:hypothetical protein [Shouchella clausii]MBU8597370.1 hypothetical protein [Shouchella clausii]
MLNENDIDFIYETRMDVVQGRRRGIIVYYEVEGEKDPVTGEGGTETLDRAVEGVVTEVDSKFKMKRELFGGIELLKGDIWFSVEIDLIHDIDTKIVRVKYEDVIYEVLAQDRKGIGRRNRWEFLGRRQS